jgi:hypothetical protein
VRCSSQDTVLNALLLKVLSHAYYIKKHHFLLCSFTLFYVYTNEEHALYDSFSVA